MKPIKFRTDLHSTQAKSSGAKKALRAKNGIHTYLPPIQFVLPRGRRPRLRRPSPAARARARGVLTWEEARWGAGSREGDEDEEVHRRDAARRPRAPGKTRGRGDGGGGVDEDETTSEGRRRRKTGRDSVGEEKSKVHHGLKLDHVIS